MDPKCFVIEKLMMLAMFFFGSTWADYDVIALFLTGLIQIYLIINAGVCDNYQKNLRTRVNNKHILLLRYIPYV